MRTVLSGGITVVSAIVWCLAGATVELVSFSRFCDSLHNFGTMCNAMVTDCDNKQNGNRFFPFFNGYHRMIHPFGILECLWSEL